MNRLVLLLVLFLGFTVGSIAQKTVTGKVTDSEGESLPGVNILVKGTNSATMTDNNGSYSIKVPNDDAVLVFKFIGMKTVEKAVGGVEVIDIQLVSEDKSIDEIVVVGFGTQKKENLTGAVASVDTKILEERPVSNAVQALQGAVAGMNFSVGNGGGELNSGLGINIRGVGSIGNTSSSPLVLIDGTEGDINTLNPQDIESISVLKDAASSAIYGSRAAFGVILIKTKAGKEGKMQVNYNNSFRWSSPVLQPDMLNSWEFANYWNEAAANAGQGLPFSKETLQKIQDYRSGKLKNETEWNANGRNWEMYTGGFADRNWFKEFYNVGAPSQEHNVSIKGGTDKVNYYLSTNYLGQEGLMKYNTDTYDRYSINAKISSQINSWLKMEYSGRFYRTDFGRSSYNKGLFYHNIARRWPTVPLKDPNGNFVYGNEVAHLNNGRSESQKDEFIQQLNFVLTPLKGWTTHLEFNYKTGTKYNKASYLPIYKYDDKGNPSPAALQFWSFWSGGASRIQGSSEKWNFFNPNIYTEYVKTLNDAHNFKIMLGFQSELSKARWISAYRDDVYTSQVQAIGATYGETDEVGGGFSHWATAGFFGRFNYNYKERYLFEFNGRYDGSSRFIRSERWNFFPSVSVGWNIAKEEFWAESLSQVVSNFKLRASYGELGNQNVVNSWGVPILYPYYVTMPLGTANGWWLVNGTRPNTASAPGLVSSTLTWERISSWDIGVDVSMLNNRLNLTFDYFYRKTFDMIGPAPQLPNILGTSVPRLNNTDMESKGFELELSWRDKTDFGLSYGAKLILTDSRQFITKYPNETGDLGQYYAGQELKEIWGYTTVGIAKTDEEMNNHLQNNKPTWGSDWQAGDIMYKDLNGDGQVSKGANTLEDHGDKTIIGNSTPRYNFGIDLDAQYKGFDVRVFLQGTAKRDIAVGGPYFTGANNNIWQSAGFQQHLDYFRPADTKSIFGANVDSYYPRPNFSTGWKNFATQTRYLQNGAYMRVKNIQLGYTVPVEATSKIGINKLRVYLSAENVFTWTKMSDIFDPETTGGDWGNGKIYPLSKIYSCGFSLTF